MQHQYDDVVAKYKDTDKWLKAPNGADTNLSERQWVLVRTPNFKRWFGDWENDPDNASQFLDENGEPKVFYHGTKYNFDVFAPTRFSDGLSFFAFNKEFSEKWVYRDNDDTRPKEITDRIRSVAEESRAFANNYVKEKYGDKRNLASEEYEDVMSAKENFERERLDGMTVSEAGRMLGARVVEAFINSRNPFIPRRDWEKVVEVMATRFAYKGGDAVQKLLKDKMYVEGIKNGDYFYYESKIIVDRIKELGYDSIVLAEYTGKEPTTIATMEPTQVKSVDNTGEFNANDPRYRHQRFFETESINKDLEEGKMVNYHELTRYRNQSDWVRAEQLASMIAATGKYEWMSTLLNNCVAEVKGTGEFFWEEITDADWKKITKLFKERAQKFDEENVAFKEEQTNGNKIIKSQMERFDGQDVEKVLKRLLAWNLNTSETSAMRRWIQQYTGKSGYTDEQNVLTLARRMESRGVFNDRVEWNAKRGKKTVKEFASKKFRYLDMVQQMAYGTTKLEEQPDGSFKKVSTDKNYRSTRVYEGYWRLALKEIEENAREIREIDQLTTIFPIEGSEQINGAAVEDNELSMSVQNINYNDVKKAKAETRKIQKRLDDAREELRELRKLQRERDVTLESLKDGAKEMGLDVDKYTTVKELANAIKEQGIYLENADELLNEYNLQRAVELEQQVEDSQQKIALLEDEVKDLNRDNVQLEIKKRRLERKLKNRANTITTLIGQLSVEKKLSREQLSQIAKLKKEIDDLNSTINKMEGEQDWLIDNLAQAYRDIEYYENTMESVNEELGNANDKNDALTKKLKDIHEALGGIGSDIRQINSIKNRLAYLERVNLENMIEASRKRWMNLLMAKTGDPLMDRNLSFFARAFFRKPDLDGNFIQTKLPVEVITTLSQTTETDAKSIIDFLEARGFIDGNTLVKGFYDLPLSDYKEFRSVINETKGVSREEKENRKKEHDSKVNYAAEIATRDIGEFTLTKEDLERARKEVQEGKYRSMEKAKKAIIIEKIGNPGTIGNENKKKSIFYNKKFNPNNNLLYASFTSFYNLLYKISPELRDLMFYGNEKQKIMGLNEVYDNWYKKQAERTGYVDDVLKKVLGTDKEIAKFKKAILQNVEVRMLSDKSKVTPWLEKQKTWQNFAKYDVADDSVSTNFTLENAFAIYEHAKQDKDIAHILDGNGVNAWQMAWVVQQFEDEDGVFHKYKEIADAYQHAYEMSWEKFQEVANKVFGIAVTRYMFYSPANSESSYKDTDVTIPFYFDADGKPVSPRQSARQKKTSDMLEKTGGNNAIRLQYVTDFANIVSKQEWMINSSEFWKMWDDIMRNDGGAVRLQIEQKFGSNVAKTVMDNMKAISYPEFSDVAHGLNKFLNWMRNNSALAKLVFSVSSTLQQPAVFFLGASKFGVKNMFKALGNIRQHGGITGFMDYVYDKSPQVKHSGDVNAEYAEKAIQNSKILKAFGAAQNVARFGLKGIEFLDKINRCIMWEAGRLYYESKGITGEQGYMRATQDTMNMNSSRQMKDNSLAYNSKNPLYKALLMFTNQLNKQWNMLIGEDGFGAVKEHRAKQFVATVVGMAFASTWVLFAKGKLLNKPEDKKWYEDVMKDYFAESISVVPAVGEKISDFINGYNYIESDIVDSMMNFVKQVLAEDKGNKKQKVGTASRDMLVEFTEFIGAPKVPVKNTLSALFKNGKYVGDEFFDGGRWARTVLPYDWFEFFEGLK